ncbi:type I pullulanase, partial [Salmonella enterica subsp. enterica serovar Typhi]|nr:type I pullulanase [Salmonella enterica subsp. enterica serovar Typhi]
MQHFVKYKCHLNENIQIGQKYEVEDANKGVTDLQIGAVIRTASFDEEFYYDGPLGVDYSSEKSIFYLWAPTAQQVKLVLKSSDPAIEERRILEMERQEKGVWKTIYLEDLEGWYYSYLVLINLEWKEAIDPYAVAVSVNGETGVIVDLNKTKRQKPVLPALEH